MNLWVQILILKTAKLYLREKLFSQSVIIADLLIWVHLPITSSQYLLELTSTTFFFSFKDHILWKKNEWHTDLVSPGIMTFINSNNAICKMAQSVKAIGTLLQSPKSYILMVRYPKIKPEISA